MIYCNKFINVVVPVILHHFLLIPSSYSAIILADELPALCLLYNNINHLNKGLWASVQTLSIFFQPITKVAPPLEQT